MIQVLELRAAPNFIGQRCDAHILTALCLSMQHYARICLLMYRSSAFETSAWGRLTMNR